MTGRLVAVGVVLLALVACGGGNQDLPTVLAMPPSPAAATRTTAPTVPPSSPTDPASLTPATVPPFATPSPAALAYLDAAIDIMRANALYADRVDWAAVRRGAHEQAARARTPDDTYPALRWALEQLGDRHSFLLDPASAAALDTAAPPMAAGDRLRGGRVAPAVGYLALPAAIGNTAVAADYVAQGQRLWAAVGDPAPCGWVLDLRGNRGGNMWPMLAVAGPLLGEGALGAFVGPAGARQTWTRRDGQIALDNEPQAAFPAPVPARTDAPVAVLTDRLTASSGEAVAVAFRGRPRTRSFGTPTAGVPTANFNYRLADGGVLVLTVARMADRTGRAYDSPITPDEPVATGGSVGDPETDTVLRAALAWLNAAQGCGRP